MESYTRKVLIGGNWKSNGDSSFIKSFDDTLKSLIVEDSSKAEVILFPTSLHLDSLSNTYKNITFGS